MTGSAIVLILIAAFGHATWNYLAKKACGGTAFIWLFAALSTFLYFPLAVWIVVVQKPVIGWHQLGFMPDHACIDRPPLDFKLHPISIWHKIKSASYYKSRIYVPPTIKSCKTIKFLSL